MAVRSYYVSDSLYRQKWDAAAQGMTSTLIASNPGLVSIHLLTADHPWEEWRQPLADDRIGIVAAQAVSGLGAGMDQLGR